MASKAKKGSKKTASPEQTSQKIGAPNQNSNQNTNNTPKSQDTKQRKGVWFNKIYIRLLSSVYLKYFFIIFTALELFYVGVDILTNLKDLPASANIQLLYACLLALSAISYTLPLSLIFAFISAFISLIRSNELVALYSVGVSKKQALAPPFLIALIITSVYVGLNFTPFAYATSYQRELLKNGNFTASTKDSFIKFDGKFVYIQSLSQKEMKGLYIFDIAGTSLKSATKAPLAHFDGKQWQLKDATTTTLPQQLELGGEGFKLESEPTLSSLPGFSPKNIEQASSTKTAINGTDALDFILTFKDEGVRLEGIKANFYNLVITPFYAPFLICIFFYYMPVTGRFLNLAFASFAMVISTFVLWGALFVLSRLALNGTINPEIAIIAPIFCLVLYTIYLRRRL